MQLRSILIILGILSLTQTGQGQDAFSAWKEYSFKDFSVRNAFPESASSEDIVVEHPYARKASASCLDSNTNTIYRLTIVHHAGTYERNPTEKFLRSVVRNWKDQEAHEFLRTDFIETEDRKAMRVISKHEEDGFSIWQVSKSGANIFVHEVISKTGDFDKAVFSHFVESLQVNDPGEPQYFRMVDTMAAIAYEMPAQPEPKRRTFDASNFGLSREIVVNSDLLRDKYQHFNYVVLYRDNPAGIVYEEVDTTLNEYQRGYEEQFNRKATQARRILIGGYHTLALSFELSHTEVEMAIIVRGNRAYVVMIEQLPDGSGLQQKKERFFNSIEFLPFGHTKRETFKIRDSLYIDFPNTPLQDSSVEYSFPYEKTYSLYALDTVSGVSYTVDDYQLSPYFWTTNYDSLMQADYDSLMTAAKVISVADTLFQGGRAHYVVYQESDTDIRLYELFFYRGPHYFNLIVITNREYEESMAWDYFNSFRFDQPDYSSGYIAIDKTEKLWQALETRDSADLNRVKYALNNRDISSKELPKVYDFLGRDLTWDTLTTPALKVLMFDKIVDLKSASSIPVLEDFYQNTPEDTLFRKQILETFLQFESPQALRTFFKYAKDFDPLNTQEYEYWEGFGDLKDTLGLAATFVDDWLPLMKHRSLRYYALELVNNLLQDSLVQASVVIPWTKQLIKEGERILTDYDLLIKDTIYVSGEIYDLRKINEVLSKLPATEAILAFVKQQFAFQEMSFLKRAVQTSLSLQYLPPDSTLSKIYESSAGDWYMVLLRANKTKMLEQFPTQRRTQRALVHSYLHHVLKYEWDTMAELEIIDQRPMSKNGEKYQVYIVKFRPPNSESFEYALCTQPQDTQELRFPPDFYDYTYYEDASEKEQVKVLLKRFVDWEKEE